MRLHVSGYHEPFNPKFPKLNTVQQPFWFIQDLRNGFDADLKEKFHKTFLI